jgi:hypothetical protein
MYNKTDLHEQFIKFCCRHDEFVMIEGFINFPLFGYINLEKSK